MSRVTSKDGTSIAYERSGNGPALILVDGALCSRAFGPSPKLAPLLARHFTVYAYDRRGRGESSDTRPYSPAREVEDIAALVEAAGGAAVSSACRPAERSPWKPLLLASLWTKWSRTNRLTSTTTAGMTAPSTKAT